MTEERRPLPSRASLSIRVKDAALIDDYIEGKFSLQEIAERHGLGNVVKVQRALAAAMRRLDSRIVSGADIMRAQEFLRLARLGEKLEAGGKLTDPKVISELRLLSESTRRLYGLDLERKVEAVEPTVFVVDMRTPNQRQNAQGEGIVEVPATITDPQALIEAPKEDGEE